MNLFESQQIEQPRIGINYENPLYEDKVSTITFGYLDEAHIQGGEDAMNWYPNQGNSSWMVMLDDLMYNG